MFDSRNTRTSLSGARRKAPTVALGVVMVSAMGIGIAGNASAAPNATVSLTVNGNTSSVTTQAPTVADLLDERGIRYDSNDLLSPGSGAQISDGLRVGLTSAVKLTVVDDAETFEQLFTARTVTGARTELNLASSSRTASTPFTSFSYERADFYSAAGTRLRAADHIHEGSLAVVRNVHIGFATKDLRVKRQVEVDRSKLLRSGSSRVFQTGRDGRKHVVYRRTFVDKQLASRDVAAARWLKKPSKRVVRIGTGPNWNGLANCESGGSPNAVSPAGFYGLYQFSLSTWHATGGQGNPTDYGYWEQTKRAWILFKGSGASSWPVCGQYL